MNNAAVDRPPPYAYVTRATKQSLRSFVIAFAVLRAAWSLAFMVTLFQELGTGRGQHKKRLATFSFVLGCLYAGTTAIFIFGTIAATTKRLALIRIFSILAIVAAVIVIAGRLLLTIVHLMLKNDLITECTALAQGSEVVFRWGIWAADPRNNLTPAEAATFCKNDWNLDSFSEILWLISDIILMTLFAVIAFSYSQQETAIASGGSCERLPATYTPAYPAGPAYAAGGESTTTLLDLDYNKPYAPPPGPPPAFDRSLPAYGSDGYDRKNDDMVKTAEDPFSDFEDQPRR